MGFFDSLGSVVGGIAGQAAGAGARGDANNQQIIANQIIQELQKAPDISKPLILEKYKQAGILTPEMEQLVSGGPSKTASIGTDQQTLDAQRQALHQMQERSVGGLSEADRAALDEANLKTQADTEAKRQQILQQGQAQSGGVGQTGRTLMAQLQAAQGGSNQQAHNANSVAQMAMQNALNATAQTGSLGGQINQQQFGQNLARSQAADEMNRFNVNNQIAQQSRNVNSANQAQASNLANLQNVGNLNTANQNAETNNQLQRQMQQYGSDVKLAGMKSDAAKGLSSWDNNLGNQQAQGAYNTYAGAGQMLQGGVNSVANAYTGGMGGMASGGQVHNFKAGGQVPGQAQVAGDSPQNDTVHALLSPDELVVPRSIAKSPIGKHIKKLIDTHHNLKQHMNGQD